MSAARRRTHEVRPRLVWSGLATAVLGMAVLAFGVGDTSWPWAVVGAVLLVAGVAVGVAGGGLHDTHRPGLLSEEVDAVVHGTTRRTVRHGEGSEAPALASREADQVRRGLLVATARAPAGPLAPMAGAVLVATGLLLLAAQEPLYPMTHAGQMGSLRVLGAGVVFTLTGLRVLMGAPGRHLPSLVLSLLAALGLFAGAVLIHHQSPSAPFVEGLGAVVGAAAAAVCLASPKLGPTGRPARTRTPAPPGSHVRRGAGYGIASGPADSQTPGQGRQPIGNTSHVSRR